MRILETFLPLAMPVQALVIINGTMYERKYTWIEFNFQTLVLQNIFQQKIKKHG